MKRVFLICEFFLLGEDIPLARLGNTTKLTRKEFTVKFIFNLSINGRNLIIKFDQMYQPLLKCNEDNREKNVVQIVFFNCSTNCLYE